MPVVPSSRMIRHLRSVTLRQVSGGPDDAQLLGRFLSERDEAAFEALVRRHGPMVFGVCRRVLGQRHDAEDAFQATFLVLACKAATVRDRAAVGSWLFAVAYRTAWRARAQAARRLAREREAAVPEARTDNHDHDDLAPLLDLELSRLPEKYRGPILLCDLQGASRKEAARRLGLPEGTLSSRLATARSMLAKRLTRRGLALACGGVSAILVENVASACVPALLIGSTVQAAARVAAGHAVTVAASASVASLAKGVMNTMLMSQLKIPLGLVLALGLVTMGWGVYQGTRAADNTPPAKEVAKAPAPEPSANRPEKPADDWPLFRGNSLQTGVAESTLADKLEILWKYETQDAIEAAAGIADGVVYVGSLDEHLYALDLKSGEKKWDYKAGPIAAPVSVRGKLIYVGDSDGVFHCIGPEGKKNWSFKTGREIKSGANFAGDSILFGSSDEHLYCVNSDGTLAWKFEVSGGPVLGTPVVVDGRTFAAGCDNTLHVLNVADGKERDTLDLGGPVAASPAVVGDRLYVGTMTNQVLGVDWKKPALEWTFEPEDRSQPFYASAAVTDKLVIVGSRDRLVHALDRKTGKEEWNFPTNGKVDSSPVVVGGRVYFGSADGNLYVLDAAKGTLIQKIDLRGPISASPAVAGGRLVIGTEKNVVYCLGAKK
jgi:RNA polymerase sigma factor (sigma-70 family)